MQNNEAERETSSNKKSRKEKFWFFFSNAMLIISLYCLFVVSPHFVNGLGVCFCNLKSPYKLFEIAFDQELI